VIVQINYINYNTVTMYRFR